MPLGAALCYLEDDIGDAIGDCHLGCLVAHKDRTGTGTVYSLLDRNLAGLQGVHNPLVNNMRISSAGVVWATLCCLLSATINTAAQRSNQLTPVPIQSVTINDSFWSPKRAVWQEVTIPDCFTKFENDRGER